MVMRNLNGDLKNGTRLIVDGVSARGVRVVEPPVYKGPGFAYGDESFKRVHYISCIMYRRNKR